MNKRFATLNFPLLRGVWRENSKVVERLRINELRDENFYLFLLRLKWEVYLNIGFTNLQEILIYIF